MLENQNFLLIFIYNDASLHSISSLVSVIGAIIFSLNSIMFSRIKTSIYLQWVEMYTDPAPDRQALDADSDVDSAK